MHGRLCSFTANRYSPQRHRVCQKTTVRRVRKVCSLSRKCYLLLLLIIFITWGKRQAWAKTITGWRTIREIRNLNKSRRFLSHTHVNLQGTSSDPCVLISSGRHPSSSSGVRDCFAPHKGNFHSKSEVKKDVRGPVVLLNTCFGFFDVPYGFRGWFPLVGNVEQG